MKAQAFFERAIREAQRYGDDRWIFLRELVQNSRDAGATHIYCHTEVRDDWAYLDFQDNGEGMNASQFEKYLLRLYASSKEQDQSAIGFYGVGFWSTLLFSPHLIRVFSCRQGQTIGYEIDCQHRKVTPLEAHLKHDGTRITLIRPASAEDSSFAEVVAEKLQTYTGPLRPAPGRDELVLMCNGEKLNQPFQVPAHFGRRIKERDFDGVIGLGDKPSIRLYKGGILVRQLTSLEEVLPNRKSSLPPAGLGIYPQVSINADGLTVLMDRQSVFEDALLQRIVEVCEGHLLKIQRQMVQQLFPMNWRNRLLHLTQNFSPRHLGWLGLVLVAVVGITWLSRFIAPPLATSSLSNEVTRVPGFVDSAFRQWQGPVIDTPTNRSISWNFKYEGGPPYLLFRVTTLTRFDKKRGWLAAPSRSNGIYPMVDAPDPSQTIRIEMDTQTTESLISLPVPPKYRLVRDSLITTSGKQPQIMQSQLGQPLVVFQQPERVSYQVAPSPEPAPQRFHQVMRMEEYPAEYISFFQQILNLNATDRAARIAEFLSEQFRYSRSFDAAKQFEKAEGTFIERIRDVGGGDCDLLNGLYALMLQTADIPAYLSVGLVGKQGKAESSLHAWVRYWADGKWITADIIAPRHFHTLRPNEAIPAGPPANLDQTSQAQATTHPPTLASHSETQTASPNPSLPTQKQAKGGFGIPILVSSGLFLMLGFLLWRRNAKKATPRLDQPHYLANLFENYFHRGMGQDPLRLHFRPMFPTLSGSALSLFQIRKLMEHTPLLGAKRDCPLVPLLPNQIPILDRDQPHYQLLAQFLPTITWLDSMAFLAHPTPLPAPLLPLAQQLTQWDPEFRLHVVPRSGKWREVYVPFRGRKLGKRHLLVGENHPEFLKILQLCHEPTPDHSFEALRLILERSTFFMGQREQLLSDYLDKYLQVAA